MQYQERPQDKTCYQKDDVVVGKIDGVYFVGMSFKWNHWTPARPCTMAGDFKSAGMSVPEGFGEKRQPRVV